MPRHLITKFKFMKIIHVYEYFIECLVCDLLLLPFCLPVILVLKAFPNWIFNKWWLFIWKYRDLSKTGYTYADTYSYNSRVKSKLWEWIVPNMSRRSISSYKSTSHSESQSQSYVTSKAEYSYASMKRDDNSGNIMSLSNASTQNSANTLMFTRSQCLGGAQCGKA